MQFICIYLEFPWIISRYKLLHKACCFVSMLVLLVLYFQGKLLTGKPLMYDPWTFTVRLYCRAKVMPNLVINNTAFMFYLTLLHKCIYKYANQFSM